MSVRDYDAPDSSTPSSPAEVDQILSGLLEAMGEADRDDEPGGRSAPSGVDAASGFLTPSARLWASVLRRAVVDYALYYRDPSHPQFEYCGVSAYNWVESDSRCCGSFLFVCGVYGVDHRAMRAKIRELTPAEVARFRGIDFGED